MGKLHDEYEREGFILLRGGIPAELLVRLQGDLGPLIGGRDSGGTSLDWRHETILERVHFRRSFVEFLDLASLNDAAREVIGTETISFVGLAVLLGRKVHSICKWHRDFHDGDPELPAMLKLPTMMVQFNCAVFDDAALWVVPGSHRRATLAAERDFARQFEKLEFTGPMGPALEISEQPLAGMPGSMHVVLKAGDCLLYNPILWHAAEYRPEWKRATLHGGWRDASRVDEFKDLQWGLEHNPWLMEAGYLGELGRNFGPQLRLFQEQSLRHTRVKEGAASKGY